MLQNIGCLSRNPCSRPLPRHQSLAEYWELSMLGTSIRLGMGLQVKIIGIIRDADLR